jgi:dTDP-4-amino-4,6-dideoxygalactose transaminase
MHVPFFRPSISDADVREVEDTLRSGWLTTGPKTKRFEQEFAAAVGGAHAVAVNSCTAALHLAIEAVGLRPGQGVLVPTFTFAATAEVVRYFGADPILVDCDPETLNLDLVDAEARLAARAGAERVVGIVPVHYAGLMLDVAAVRAFAVRHDLWVVEDAAHAFPAAWRPAPEADWQRCGERTSEVACFSFYANKTITTGEGGMAVTADEALAERMRMMSLHGLSRDAWRRYQKGGAWNYDIVAPGFKYNMTDVAAALGLQQLRRAEALRLERQAIAHRYLQELADLKAVELPPAPVDRVHAWHLFAVRLQLEALTATRDVVVEALAERGVQCSVHWKPLHLHPYYMATYGYAAEQFPAAAAVWPRLVSLPIFPGMLQEELSHVVESVRMVCRQYAR